MWPPRPYIELKKNFISPRRPQGPQAGLRPAKLLNFFVGGAQKFPSPLHGAPRTSRCCTKPDNPSPTRYGLGPRAVHELLHEVAGGEGLDHALGAYERLSPGLLIQEWDGEGRPA